MLTPLDISSSELMHAPSSSSSDSSDSLPSTLLSSRSSSPPPSVKASYVHNPSSSLPLPSSLSGALSPSISFDDDPSFIPRPEDPHSLRHAEFGHCDDQRFRATSVYQEGTSLRPVEESPSYFTLLATYWSYAFLIVVGHIRDFVGKRYHSDQYKHLQEHDGYAPLMADYDSFFTRRIKTRFDDCFSRPITSVPSRTATLLTRTSTLAHKNFSFTGSTAQALNVSSYNYLGFAQSRGLCADAADATVREYGLSACGTRADVGGSDLHIRAERLVARFMGTEDAMILPMGFATNSTALPALVGKGCLVISDELNHSSIRFGARLSGASVRQYKHNDMDDLEKLLREVVSQGQPRRRRAWDKILIVVEGLYSMEGTLVDLRRILELKETYKFYLYVDEAHSIGALGPHGRGVCDYFNVDPKKIDILMGTFTKSFGAAGGYLAGSHNTISALRNVCTGTLYGESTTPPVLAQLISSMSIILGDPVIDSPLSRGVISDTAERGEGEDRLRRLAFNARYLRMGLKRLGFMVYGHDDSPIVPLLIFQPGKLATFSRMMLKRHLIVVVVVGYPATPLVSARARFCVSAAHTKDDLDRLLRATDDVGSALGLKLMGPGMDIEDVINGAVDDVFSGGREVERVY